MAAIYNNQSVNYGSRVITISGSNNGAFSGSYVCDNITLENPTKTIDRTNQLDEPSGFVLVQDFENGSGQLQIATSATPVPKPGAIFATNLEHSASFTTYVITSTSQPETKEGEKKLSFNFRKTY